MIWVLFYADTPNPMGVPGERPARVSRAEMRSPWVAMTPDDYAQVLAETQAAYETWKASRPTPKPDGTTRIEAVDGSQWRVSSAGRIEPA